MLAFWQENMTHKKQTGMQSGQPYFGKPKAKLQIGLNMQLRATKPTKERSIQELPP